MSTLRSVCWSSLAFLGIVSFLTMSLLPAAVLGVPLVVITKPEDGAVVHGQTWIDVHYRSDGEQSIAAIELYVDDEIAHHWRLSVPRKEGKQAFSWDFSFAAATTHKITAKAIDAGGNEGSTFIVVEVQKIAAEAPDQIPPVVSIYYPAQGAKVSGEAEIKANATDNVGVTTVFFYVDGVFKTLIMHAPPYTTKWDTTKAQDGPHVLQAKAWDAAENVAASAEVTVIVENRSMTLAHPDPGEPVRTDVVQAPKVASPTPAVDVAPAVVAPAVDEGSVEQQEFGQPVVSLPTLQSETQLTETEVRIAALPTAPEPTRIARTSEPPRVRPETIASPVTPPSEAVGPPADESGPGLAKSVPAPTNVMLPPAARAGMTPAGARTSGPVVQLVTTVSSAARPTPTQFAMGPSVLTTVPASNSAAWPVSAETHASSQAASHAAPAAEYEVAMLPRSSESTGVVANKVSSPPTVPVTPTVIAAVKEIKVVFDGELLDLRSAPEVKQGISLAPLREIFEHTDGMLYWFHVEKKVHAVNDRVDLELQIGDPQVRINDRTETLVLAPYIKRGRTMVPLNFLAEALDVTIRFNPATGQLVVTSNDF